MTGLFLVGMLLCAAAAFGQWPFGAKEYAGDISAQAFLVPLQAAANVLAAPEGFSAESLAPAELPPESRVCLLLVLQNNGNRRAWGVAEMLWNGREIAVDVPGLPPHMEYPSFNVVEVSDWVLGAGIPDSVEVRWRKLSAK